ncbi:plasmid pRiA4b ORF-3 family protein [Sphaerisporangium sp. NBC_01403]|uniref:plasmid pRiA4b ORF-3 family protein n=1 Tax=Sphaerisporangium sp. NBC_01403 TaxID=2903599 RepID=UPI003249623E
MHWVAVDHALAALDRHGATDAWYILLDAVDGDVHDAVRDSGHPDAVRLLAALPLTPPPIPVYQLKISLYGGLWRRVLVPENLTLGHLHGVISDLFGWGDDHLHVFSTAKRRYADPFHRLEECGDEYTYRINRALPSPHSKITYVYDLGDTWRHEILLEKVRDDEVTHPVCVAGRGDNPIEHYDPEYPEDPVPFDQDAINKQLATRFVRADVA